MRNKLAPDWPVHAVMLSIQQILGLLRFLTPSTGPVVVTLASVSSRGILITCPKPLSFLDLMWLSSSFFVPAIIVFSCQQFRPWTSQQLSITIFFEKLLAIKYWRYQQANRNLYQ